jgi:hypothetical protein
VIIRKIRKNDIVLFIFITLFALILGGCGSSGGGDGGQQDPNNTPTDIEDMQGVWKGTTNTQIFGEEQTTFTLTQNGSDISGTLKLTDTDNNSYEAEANGSINNSSANISSIFDLEDGNGNIEYVYNGTIDGNTFSGNINLFENGVDTNQGGTFTVSKGSNGGNEGDQPSTCYEAPATISCTNPNPRNCGEACCPLTFNFYCPATGNCYKTEDEVIAACGDNECYTCDSGDGGGNGGSNGLAAPTLIRPVVTNGQVGSYCPIDIIFEWSVVPDATTYQVFIQSAGDVPAVREFDAGLICSDTCTTNEFPLEELPAGITQWFVRACDSSDCGPQSTTEEFDILPVNSCP